MFASLKNKIKEETGSDVSAGSFAAPQRISNNNRMRSRFSSTISVNSTDDGATDLQNNLHEQLSSLRGQCNELSTKVTDLNGRLQTMQQEKLRVEKTNEILLETVKVAQTQKDVYCEEQEKIQNMQQAEIEKLKNLLSFREQEAVDRLAAQRQSQQQIENLMGELERLKKMEPIVEDLQISLESDTKDLQLRLQTADDRFTDYATDSEGIALSLRQQLTQLQDELGEMQNKFELEREEKLTALLRNAEISQSEEILKKELRVERAEVNELNDRNQQLVEEVKMKEQEVNSKNSTLQELQTMIAGQDEKLQDVEQAQLELEEKNKTIKMLNQRLSDIKKTLQKELRSNKKPFDKDMTAPAEIMLDNGFVSPTVTKDSSNCFNCAQSLDAYTFATNPNGGIIMDEVNFKYLKHVIVKFLTSREVEARHLIRAVATLLKLNKEEEQLLHDTLNWKMSWFGSKPDHGSGQRAISIPPS